MDTYGYVRVSTKEQNEDRQIIAMREFGVADSRIVLDKQSGSINPLPRPTPGLGAQQNTSVHAGLGTVPQV